MARLEPSVIRALLERNAFVLDVRSQAEFAGGHVPGSLNLPMHQIPARAAELLPKDRPLLVCCASGARSAMAVDFLARQGYEAYNLGPWSCHPGLS